MARSGTIDSGSIYSKKDLIMMIHFTIIKKHMLW